VLLLYRWLSAKFFALKTSCDINRELSSLYMVFLVKVCIGVILGGYEGYAYPPVFGVGVPYPPLFKSCHKKNYDANLSV